METEIILGKAPNGTDRRLDCWMDGEGRLALWIHSPGSDMNGWQVHIPPEAMRAVLAKLGVAGEPDSPSSAKSSDALERLLERVNEDNIHQEQDLGVPVGREVW